MFQREIGNESLLAFSAYDNDLLYDMVCEFCSHYRLKTHPEVVELLTELKTTFKGVMHDILLEELKQTTIANGWHFIRDDGIQMDFQKEIRKGNNISIRPHYDSFAYDIRAEESGFSMDEHVSLELGRKFQGYGDVPDVETLVEEVKTIKD